jgi:hypothetical protein
MLYSDSTAGLSMEMSLSSALACPPQGVFPEPTQGCFLFGGVGNAAWSLTHVNCTGAASSMVPAKDAHLCFDGSSFACSYLTVKNCQGSQTFWSNRAGSLDYATFCGNVVHSTQSIVGAYEAGFALSHCDFWGNAGTLFGFRSTKSTAPFRLSGCRFTDPGPGIASNLWVDEGSNLFGDSDMTTMPMPALNTEMCPGAGVPFASATLDASSSPLPSSSPRPPQTPVASLPPTQTPVASRVKTAAATDSPCPTSSPVIAGCDQVSDLTTRYVQETVCLEIIRCFFADLSANQYTDPGAILARGFAFTGIIECTFSHCVSVTGSGGAVAIGSDRNVVDRTCGSRCSCFEFGQFIAFFPPTGGQPQTARLHLSSTVECAPASDVDAIGPRMGAIDFWGAPQESVQYTNFTSCFLHPDYGGTGTAFELDGCGRAIVTFLTVANCSGNVAIDNKETEDGSRIEYANFYDNVLPNAEYSLIQSISYGLSLSNCVFSGNILEGQILGFTGTINTRFQVYDCVFSGAFPSSSGVSIMTGTRNQQNAQTASIPLPQLGTGLCPQAGFVPTPSQSPEGTETRSPRKTDLATRSRGCGVGLYQRRRAL